MEDDDGPDTLRFPEMLFEDAALSTDAAESALLNEDVWLTAGLADGESATPATSGVFPIGLYA